MRFLALLLVVFTLSLAQARTLGEPGAAQIVVPDSWFLYEKTWVNPEQTVGLKFGPDRLKGEVTTEFSKAYQSKLVEHGYKVLTDSPVRSLGNCQVASFLLLSNTQQLLRVSLIGKGGAITSLTLLAEDGPSNRTKLESLEAQFLNSLRWP